MPFLRERNGRWSFPKIVAFVAVVLPALWLAWLSATGGLGPRPLNEAIHQTGSWAVRFLLLSLAVTPARRVLGVPRLILTRRTIGVAAFAWAALHLTLYGFDQKLDLAKIASEIVLRVYLTIGFVALVGLAALAVTSTDGMVRRLGGPRWQALHRLAYPIAMLAILHFLMQTKLDVTESIMMAGFLAWLLLYRLAYRFLGDLRPLKLAALALVAAAATALGEAAWYGVTTGVDPTLVLAANLDVSFGLRPAAWVLTTGLAIAVLAALRAVIPLGRTTRGAAPRGGPVPARATASPGAGGGTR
ncbi:sulfoxide reductase heme-binding subunit YedZ [Rhodoplanes sp. TEM]|uniref:Protein-methionine-sulfoxide reductase heme-binding subunit MsrQ n=1 Tax=Rhodoplanes tepidamans TaxID=200616 RepID=A0ABT5J4T1_RHOTP|nr:MULTISPECIES: protein-methionine-sulfoxide reductase heme-binding subunit MsrQ [Rhodoplanes]MDC7784648.1 sulfoxide reductase heme-binding subunit YedZ [Rhodoplanes tepidamans]MDC7982115.1 sulfoxide reductase heme-binding subunit YedZ [Rhodoplanes sp. TEM]MDQ0356116.1 sulfoxide reductase heme-binding subunit YedZ [Rhodoplanes tepidamans]